MFSNNLQCKRKVFYYCYVAWLGWIANDYRPDMRQYHGDVVVRL